VVGEDRLDLDALAAVDERQLVVDHVQVQAADVLALRHRLEHARAAADLFGHLQVHAAVPEHGPVDPGHRGEQLAAVVALAHVHQRHDDAGAARAQAGDLVARRGRRVARLDARGLERGGVVGRGRRGHAEHADLQASGVDDLVGVEQALAVAAVKVRRQQRDARALRQPPQQRQTQREIALAGQQRGRPEPSVRAREQARAPFDLAGVGAHLAGEVDGARNEQIARVQHQRHVGLGARAIDHRRAARDAAQRVDRAAALLVIAVVVRRVEKRDLLAARRRRQRGRRRAVDRRHRRRRAVVLARALAGEPGGDNACDQRGAFPGEAHRATLAERFRPV